MKIDENAPAFPSGDQSLRSHLAGLSHRGIPTRVYLAAQFLAGRFANDASDFGAIDGTYEGDESMIALTWADALINAHNATCEVADD